MKIQLYSDLHLEFAPFQPSLLDSDAVILAGDIGVGAAGVKWAGQMFPDRPVIYVVGNHEFYYGDFESVWADLRRHCPLNVHLLDNQAVEIGAVRFLGCALWTDYALFGMARREAALVCANAGLNDHRIIRLQPHPFGRIFRAEDALALHLASRAWLQEELARPFDGKTVVVTHHAPHAGSVAAQYQDDLLSAAFASDLTALMGPAALWVHGHMHSSCDYEVEGTRVVANPRGYPMRHSGFENPEFLHDRMITI